MCKYCIEDGSISRETAEKIYRFVEEWPQSAFGPFHIVFDDFNVEDDDIEWCIKIAESVLADDPSLAPDDFRDEIPRMDYLATHDRAEIEASLSFARELLLIPEDIR